MTKDPIDSGKVDEGIVDGVVDVDGKDVDIATGVTPTAQAAHGVKSAARIGGTQMINHGGCSRVRIGDEVPPGPSAPFGDRAQNELLLLGSEAPHFVKSTRLGRAFKFFDGLDSQSTVQQADRLRAESLQGEQLQEGGWILLELLGVIRGRAGVRQFPNTGRQVLSDSRDRPEGVDIHIAHPLGDAGERLGGVAIRPYLEGIRPLDLQQMRDLLEDPSDVLVVHVPRTHPTSVVSALTHHDLQTVGVDLSIDDGCPRVGERPPHGGRDGRIREKQQTSTAPGPTDLGAPGPGFQTVVDEGVDRQGGDARRQLFTKRPLASELSTHLVPRRCLERPAHDRGHVGNLVKQINDAPVAVDVPLRDVPVVDSRVTGLSRVGEDDPSSELIWIDAERRPRDPGWTHFNRRDTAEHRRTVVLYPSWNTNDLRLEIGGKTHQRLSRVGRTCISAQRAAEGDV